MLKMKARRQQMGLTQTALGFHTGISPSDISRIENQRLNPYPSQVQKLARALKMPPEELTQPARLEVEEVEAG